MKAMCRSEGGHWLRKGSKSWYQQISNRRDQNHVHRVFFALFFLFHPAVTRGNLTRQVWCE